MIAENFFLPSDEIRKQAIKIAPQPHCFYESEYEQLFCKSVENLLYTIIPNDCFEKLNKDMLEFYSELYQRTPIIYTSTINSAPSCFSFVVLCSNDFTEGVSKFIPDMLARWLTPGKTLSISAQQMLSFHFKNAKQKTFFICNFYIQLQDKKMAEMVKTNLPLFIKEIRLNILSVYHARSIISMKKLSIEQQSIMIRDNIFSLIKKSPSFEENTSFDQMQNFINKLSSEKKLSEIEKNLSFLMHKKPKTFDRDIFSAVHNMMYLFPSNFIVKRDPRHISRIIGFQYLFRKTIYQLLYNFPNKRHLNLKLLKTRLIHEENNSMVLGVLITLNFINEAERFKKNHILEAIWYCVQDVQFIDGSYVVDRRDEKIFSYYLEIEKINKSNFSFEEIKNLRKRLPQEILNRIENPIHPIFMPRNEEEVLRNIILLRKQIKYVRDLPQVIISYDKQTGSHITFNVILVRLLKAKTLPLKKYFSKSSTFLRAHFEETKKIGYLKKKYPIESNIFRISLKKLGFFRQDFSLDLQKARQCIATELVNIIGNFRDYNGGMILKQSQALDDVKKIMNEKNEVLLENFFYSLTPGVMQSILPSEIIKKIFLTLKRALRYDFSENELIKVSATYKGYFLISIASFNLKHIDEIFTSIQKLKIPSFDLIKSSLEINKIHTLSYIYKISQENQQQVLIKTIDKYFDQTQTICN